MKKLFLIPIIALSLVSCGEEKELKYENNLILYNDSKIYQLGAYSFEGFSKKGHANFSDFQFVFFEDKKSQLSYNIDFYYDDYSTNEYFKYDGKITFNYTDYTIDEDENIYFYGDNIPSEFSFKYVDNITTTKMIIHIRDKSVSMYEK